MRGLDAIARAGARIAVTRAGRRRDAIATEAQTLGLVARVEGETVVLEGRGLLERWLRDASLRDIGRSGA